MELTTKTGSPRAHTKRADALFDFLADRPNGATVTDMRNEFGWGHGQTNQAIRALRKVLAEDVINVVCEPHVHRGRWLYRLVGHPADSRFYVTNRLLDLEARLETQQYVTESLEHATDGRTVEGRKARKIARTLSYLQKELADIDA